MTAADVPRRPVVGVMGGGRVAPETLAMARELGERIARQGWLLLNGGRNAGVMAASARGAAEAGGLTIGILPGTDSADAAPHILIPIPTGMGSARNLINVLAAAVVIACPGGAGTLSEVALALKYGKPVICLAWDPGSAFQAWIGTGQMTCCDSPRAAVEQTARLLARDLCLDAGGEGDGPRRPS